MQARWTSGGAGPCRSLGLLRTLAPCVLCHCCCRQVSVEPIFCTHTHPRFLFSGKRQKTVYRGGAGDIKRYARNITQELTPQPHADWPNPSSVPFFWRTTVDYSTPHRDFSGRISLFLSHERTPRHRTIRDYRYNIHTG